MLSLLKHVPSSLVGVNPSSSLSEVEGLTWARVPGLSEFMRITMFICALCAGLITLSSL